MDEQPMLDGLPTFEWNSQEAVSYEVAIEAITEAVACYTALIQQAQQNGAADLAQDLSAAQAHCIAERNHLRSTDHTAVARVRREYPQLTRKLRAQIQ